MGNIIPIWTSKHTKIAMLYSLIICGITLAYFNLIAIQPIWFLITLCITVWYFATLSICSNKWKYLAPRKFENKLFWHSLFYRVLTSVILITVAYIEWGRPDYVGAVDAINFHEEAIIVSDYLRSLDFSGAYSTARSFYFGIDNIGPSLFIGFIFALTGNSYFLATVIMAILGSFVVLLLYRIGKLIWSEQIGRTAGIMFMHFPLSLFFSVVIMKEGVVLFLLMIVIYLLTKVVNGQKLRSYHILLIIFSLFSLFFFRTVVGMILVIVVAGTLMLNKYKGSRIKSWSIGTLTILVFSYLIYSLGEFQFFIDRFSDAGDVRYARATRFGLDGISLKYLLVAPFFFVFSLITPIPGFVETTFRFDVTHESRHYFLPGLLVWNILVFYSIIGLYHSIKGKFMQSMPLWGFTVMYSVAMIVSFFFSRVRFSYLGMSILILLAAVGVTRSSNNIYWKLYLILLVFVILAWNVLRLSVRGVA